MAVRMVPAPADANTECQSFWASLTFEARSGVLSLGQLINIMRILSFAYAQTIDRSP